MSDLDDLNDQLGPAFPGGYVAWLDGQVVMASDTCDGLLDRLSQTTIDETRVVVGYVPPAGAVFIPSFKVVELPLTGC
jgi:hypothetical protein